MSHLPFAQDISLVYGHGGSEMNPIQEIEYRKKGKMREITRVTYWLFSNTLHILTANLSHAHGSSLAAEANVVNMVFALNALQNSIMLTPC